jgi:hypothetical protein
MNKSKITDNTFLQVGQHPNRTTSNLISVTMREEDQYSTKLDKLKETLLNVELLLENESKEFEQI